MVVFAECKVVPCLIPYYNVRCKMFLSFQSISAIMFAIIYSFHELVTVKQSYQYFSFNPNYGQKQTAKPKWKCDSGEYQ